MADVISNLASTAVQKLEWKGEQVLKDMQRAQARAIGYVIAACVREAKHNHPGWKRRSGRAEKSIHKLAITRERDRVVGQWGSKLFYVLFLERDHGSFLRNAGDKLYPMLPGKIREFYENP